MGIFSTAASDEKWEADFRSQIDPQLAIGAAQIVVEVRDKSKKAAQKRLPEYIKVMADHGYKLTQTDMHRTGLTSSWGLTFVPRRRRPWPTPPNIEAARRSPCERPLDRRGVRGQAGGACGSL